ncbi:hypothetical protein RND71_033779 [Anisodus tanguticus]|uniref:Protein CHUP1, chloroplastic n=1 Tax=Anisodus tanguticus TaxID=243964 RepID=A0AAE1V4A1_9SOLA|nr:hypothetical protein RND71_033779 [Anisodus tanguticus]
MGEEKSSENRPKASKFADQNKAPKGSSNSNVKGNINLSKVRSSWGSQIVKGFSGERKTKLHTTIHAKKETENSNQKNSSGLPQSRVKRSLMGDLSCSATSTQVHPQTVNIHRTKSTGSRDLFNEIDHLRSLLQESKGRELKLQAELSEFKRSLKAVELERELELKKSEIDSFVKKVELLEWEKAVLSYQLEKQDEITNREEFKSVTSLEMEVVELRRLNKELQLQKRDIACRLSSMESQLAIVGKVPEGDTIEHIKAEASLLRHKNENLCKQVEGLQMSRLNEVEELAYLKWVNSCLREEMRSCSSMTCDKTSSPHGSEKSRESLCLSYDHSDEDSKCSSARRLSLVKKLKKWPITDEDMQPAESPDNIINHSWEDTQSSTRRHSISGSKFCVEDLIFNKRRQSDGFMCSKEVEKEIEPLVSQHKLANPLEVEKRVLRIPNPPPRPSSVALIEQEGENSVQVHGPPPPPPPPPPKLMGKATSGMVQRAPQVVEFYHSLMKRDSRKDSLNGGVCDSSSVADIRSSMIGEIENRSSYLLAIRADVETQAEFVNSLIAEVNNAVYSDIKDVVAFVKWLDDELCFLVDERAVLKHFDWPERKADTLREAAFGYRDLKKLENEVSSYKDDPRSPCDISLKKMISLSEKMERSVYNLLRTRDSLMRHCKEFKIPTDWMLDNGILSKIKFGSVKLAKVYMKRVAAELQSKGPLDKDTSMDYMLLQGVRFAFRIHQFAGGFDAETMQAFEELRGLALSLNKT